MYGMHRDVNLLWERIEKRRTNRKLFNVFPIMSISL
jgi:hypothetical protein